MTKPQLYFPSDNEWRTWLHDNHTISAGVYLILYKVSSETKSMRWEEAVKVALCYGWIDSTVKRLDHEKRQQYFTPRKHKSVWSKLNKTYIKELSKNESMHVSGKAITKIAKQNVRIYEIPITYEARRFDEGKKIGWKDGVAAFWYIFKFNLFY